MVRGGERETCEFGGPERAATASGLLWLRRITSDKCLPSQSTICPLYSPKSSIRSKTIRCSWWLAAQILKGFIQLLKNKRSTCCNFSVLQLRVYLKRSILRELKQNYPCYKVSGWVHFTKRYGALSVAASRGRGRHLDANVPLGGVGSGQLEGVRPPPPSSESCNTSSCIYVHVQNVNMAKVIRSLFQSNFTLKYLFFSLGVFSQLELAARRS